MTTDITTEPRRDSDTVHELVRNRMTIDEWMAEGTRRFGPDQFKWRFVCPACGHVQAVEDFRPYKASGATAETAHFNCIGRYAGADANAGLSGTGKAKGPCNYTSGGLFDLRPLTIITADGDVKVFAFADVPNKEVSIER